MRDLKRYAEIYIYGAGTIGKLLAEYLTDVEEIGIKGLVVSDGHRNESEFITFLGRRVPIFEIGELGGSMIEGAVFFNTLVVAKEIIKQNIIKSYPCCEYLELLDEESDEIAKVIADMIDDIEPEQNVAVCVWLRYLLLNRSKT